MSGDNAFARIEGEVRELRAVVAQQQAQIVVLAAAVASQSASFVALCTALGQDVLPGEAPIAAEAVKPAKAKHN